MILPDHGTVVDIGGGDMSSSILLDLRRVLALAEDSNSNSGVVPAMPDELLYDDKGLLIWADIIFTPEFYQTHDEIALLQRYSREIAAHYIPNNAVLIDIGAGDMNKVNYLLEELAWCGRKTSYLALDISRRSLASNLADLAFRHTGGSVSMAGLWGNFEAGLAFAEAVTGSPRVLLSLGSVLFNDPWRKAVTVLRDWAAVMRPEDVLLAGMDGHDVTSNKVWDAYHSHPVLFEKFFHNGLEHANALLGEDVFRPDDWDIHAEVEKKEKRHRFFLRANRNIVSEQTGSSFRQGLELDWFDAHKRSENDVCGMCTEAGLEVVKSWAIEGSAMRQYLIRRRQESVEKTYINIIYGAMN